MPQTPLAQNSRRQQLPKHGLRRFLDRRGARLVLATRYPKLAIPPQHYAKLRCTNATLRYTLTPRRPAGTCMWRLRAAPWPRWTTAPASRKYWRRFARARRQAKAKAPGSVNRIAESDGGEPAAILSRRSAKARTARRASSEPLFAAPGCVGPLLMGNGGIITTLIYLTNNSLLVWTMSWVCSRCSARSGPCKLRRPRACAPVDHLHNAAGGYRTYV